MTFINISYAKISYSILLFLSTTLFLLIIQPPLLSASQTEYNDHVLRDKTIWTGTIIIKGVLVVGRGATLVIKPGTTVTFRKIDRNADGIGDSEIRVLGRLLAEGTKDNPITFRSAESDPLPKDWSYVLIFSSGEVNKLQYCIFNHAFTGFQVHFSTASISNSLFEHNFEGIRFGRAKLLIKHNTMRNNDVGIRFTRMEGPATISGNTVIKNRIGIFLVPSGQNIQNFFEPDRSGQPWNTGKMTITGNNIYDNLEYNLSLGEKQIWNLDVSGNWWGTNDHLEIKKYIFDFYSDASLGKAIFLPIVNSEITNGGNFRGEFVEKHQKDVKATAELN